ncbi:hypothetical protein VQ575_11210 [Pseudomonas frederiksbergensis]|nr:hypothetical protein [Pseudomonas frederiksbergensis]WRV71061.1 hypothetical protein VQ575_11210 [Pseudomonas frederiksbergensis]
MLQRQRQPDPGQRHQWQRPVHLRRRRAQRGRHRSQRHHRQHHQPHQQGRHAGLWRRQLRQRHGADDHCARHCGQRHSHGHQRQRDFLWRGRQRHYQRRGRKRHPGGWRGHRQTHRRHRCRYVPFHQPVRQLSQCNGELRRHHHRF